MLVVLIYLLAISLCLFIRFKNVGAGDVVRHYIPDVVVLVLSFISGLLLAIIVNLEKKAKLIKKTEEKLSEQPLQSSSISRETSVSPEADTKALLNGSEVLTTSNTNVLHQLHSTELSLVGTPDLVTEFGSKIGETTQQRQQKQKLNLFPKIPITLLLSIVWKLLYIVFLWFSGVCVASALNSVYFIFSIFLCLCWALHFNQIRVFMVTQRVIVVLVSLYSAIHLIILYLYQFQSAQELVPRSNLTARYVCV